VGAHMTQALNGIEHEIEAERQQEKSEQVR